MRKQSFFFRWFSGFILLCFYTATYAALAYTDLTRYHDSGQYKKELQAVVARASTYILNRVHLNQESKHPQKLAIVLDIDETSLSNYHHMHHHHFTKDLNIIRQYLLTANSPAISATKSLYREALANNVNIFFITGRRETTECAAAQKNLKRIGYTKWAGLYCRPNTDHKTTARYYKAKQRQAITKQGYTIIATIGDQNSDIQGGYAEKGFKLPNPFYTLP